MNASCDKLAPATILAARDLSVAEYQASNRHAAINSLPGIFLAGGIKDKYAHTPDAPNNHAVVCRPPLVKLTRHAVYRQGAEPIWN